MRHLARHLALACLLWSSAMPANAYDVHIEIAGELARIGVSIHRSWNCDPGELSSYDDRTAQLAFCSNNLNSAFLVNQTLTHSAVYAVQDCLFGTIGDSYSGSITSAIARSFGKSEAMRTFETKIAPSVPAALRQHIMAKVPPEERHAVIEAYALQDHPNAVLALLKTCP